MRVRDPLTGAERLVVPARSERLDIPRAGCPFCPGNEEATPPETARVGGAAWRARSFPNRFPLTSPHEVLVPTREHVSSWRHLDEAQLADGIALLLDRRAALAQHGSYVHAFINDGEQAGASIEHVHAQLVVVERGAHTDALVAGVCDARTCALCVLLDTRSELLVARGSHCSIIAHPVPRLGGALLLVPNEHASAPADAPVEAVAAMLRRMWAAIDPDAAANLWLVADEQRGAHWYIELQPRSAYLAGVELALGISVSGARPEATAASARARLETCD